MEHFRVIDGTVKTKDLDNRALEICLSLKRFLNRTGLEFDLNLSFDSHFIGNGCKTSFTLEILNTDGSPFRQFQTVKGTKRECFDDMEHVYYIAYHSLSEHYFKNL